MTTIQALIIAVIQGSTELFPVSSLGHAVILPALLGWNLDQRGEAFLPFLVMLHLGTSAALLGYFRRDWLALGSGVLGLGDAHTTQEARRVFLLIVVATIPAMVVGFVLERPLRALFGTPQIAAAFLAVNGIVLLVGENLRARLTRTVVARSPLGEQSISGLSMRDAFVIGCWQCAALIPGISRSGATIVGGLLRGIDHARSAHFSFLIALPIILGATVLEVPHLLHHTMPQGVLSQAVLAAIVSGIVAYVSTVFLMRYFRDHERWALNPFAYYCLVVGIGSLIVLRLL